MKRLLYKILRLSAMVFPLATQAQEEFPKGWVMYLEASQGVVTNFHAAQPDLYAGNLQLSPQVTLIPGYLRLAATGGGAFYNKKLVGMAGGGLNVNLATIRFNPFGSLLNLQAQLQHIWGTGKQQLLGGGIKAELGQIIMLGFTAHRDYHFGEWWLQTGLGFNLLHKKKSGSQDPFEKGATSP